MASRTTALLITAAMAVVVVSALLPAIASADVYKVGAEQGWGLNVDYNAWANGLAFKVFDVLVFVFSSEQHNVVLVDPASFQACTVLPYAVTWNSGNDTVPLYEPGQYFFISGINTDCNSGMKFTINVAHG